MTLLGAIARGTPLPGSRQLVSARPASHSAPLEPTEPPTGFPCKSGATELTNPTGSGRVGTLWARALDDAESAGTRYLYLRGASRTNLPPYGLADLLTRPSDERREIVLVEGFLDLHQLRAREVEHIAALGGTSVRPQAFERLHRLGIETVTLCLDNDEAGRAATARAIENAARARRSPDIHVIHPERLAPFKDPDEFVRQGGVTAWHELLAARTCGITWRAHELAAVTPDSSVSERRAALARAGRWLGTLPPRLAIEQEDALRSIAARCGYTAEAVERAFRARYWSRSLGRTQPSQVQGPRTIEIGQ